MRHLLIISLVTLGISCTSNKATIPTGESMQNIDLSDYIMVCFNKDYLADNKIEIPGNGRIHVIYSENKICVNKKDYITYHLSYKAFIGDQ